MTRQNDIDTAIERCRDMRDVDVDYINAPLDCLADWKLLADEYIRQQSSADPITSFVPAISVEFTVYGRPQQRGSKSPWIPRYKDGSMVMKGGKPVIATMDSNKKSKPWMSQVQAAAYESMLGRDLLMGAIALSVEFYFARPKSHFRTGKNAGILKDDAPMWHTQTPDLAKLVRCLEDALKGIVWRDDCLVCEYRGISKHWTTAQERAEVTIMELPTRE